MPEINGESLAPRAGIGAAYILGRTTPDALQVLQQGLRNRDAAAYRAAQLRAKEAEQISKDAAENQKINYDGGGIFQEASNQQNALLPEELGAITARVQKGEISRMQGQLEVSKVKGRVERERVLSVDKDRSVMANQTKDLADPFRDKAGVYQAYGDALLDPNKKRVLASNYDELAVGQAIAANAMTYKPSAIFEDYAKKLALSTIDQAHAGRVGGTHSSSSLTYKGLTPVLRADGTYDVQRDGADRPTVSMSAEDLATKRATDTNMNMAMTRLEMEEKKKADAEGRAPRPAIDLFQEGARDYFSFKQNDATGRNAAAPVGRAGAGQPKYVTANPNAGGYATYGVTTNRDGGSTAGSGSLFMGMEPQRQSISTGKMEPFTRDNVVFNDFHVEQPGSSLTHVKNNSKPQNLQFGPIMQVPYTRSGEIMRPTRPADTATPEAYKAWLVDALATHPGSKSGWAARATPKRGINDLGSEEDAYRSLATANDDSSNPKSKEELRQQARKIMSAQNAVYYKRYTPESAPQLNSYTKGFYSEGQAGRNQMDRELNAQVEQYRSQHTKPAPTNSTGGAYTPKVKAPAIKAAKASSSNQTTPGTGGAY